MGAPHSMPRRLRVHLAIHVLLLLVYFVPGGLIWNRLEPSVFGVPFGVFMWWIALPTLMILNVVMYVRGFWAQDKLVPTGVRGDPATQGSEEIAENDATPPESSGSDEGEK